MQPARLPRSRKLLLLLALAGSLSLWALLRRLAAPRRAWSADGKPVLSPGFQIPLVLPASLGSKNGGSSSLADGNPDVRAFIPQRSWHRVGPWEGEAPGQNRPGWNQKGDTQWETITLQAPPRILTFSAYRAREDRAVLLVLLARADLDLLNQTEAACDVTVPTEDGSLRVHPGRVFPMPGWDMGQERHVSAALFCMLDPAPSAAGGASAAQPKQEASAEWNSLPALGVLRMSLWGTTTIHASVGPGPLHPPNSTAPMDLPLVFCGSPMFPSSTGHALPAQSVLQWVVYHRFHLSVDRFVLYTSGAMPADVVARLGWFTRRGIVEVVDFERENELPSFAHAQMLASNDCMWSVREHAGWVLFGDMDEYVHVLALPHTLASAPDREKGFFSLAEFLAAEGHRYSDISRGAHWFGVQCDEWEEQGQVPAFQFAVERLVYRSLEPACHGNWERPAPEVAPELCPGEFGHRKLMVNPRKVPFVQVGAHHVWWWALDGASPYRQSLDLPTTFIYNAHFKGINLPKEDCLGERRIEGAQYFGLLFVAGEARRQLCNVGTNNTDPELMQEFPCTYT